MATIATIATIASIASIATIASIASIAPIAPIVPIASIATHHMPKASCYPRMSSLHSPFPARPQLRPTLSKNYNTNPRSKIGGDL